MKIICIGKNYRKHVLEMGETSIAKEPVIFLKPDSALLPKKHSFVLPPFSNDVHYEVEIVIKICKVGKYIQKEDVHNYYKEIGLGIDFTARDKQAELKKAGLPWEKAKAFDFSTYVSPFLDKNTFDIQHIHFRLEQNKNIVQTANTSEMLYTIDELISHISEYFTLKIGDLIFTGTPEGVGPVHEGDILEGYIQDKQMFSLKVFS